MDTSATVEERSLFTNDPKPSLDTRLRENGLQPFEIHTGATRDDRAVLYWRNDTISPSCSRDNNVQPFSLDDAVEFIDSLPLNPDARWTSYTNKVLHVLPAITEADLKRGLLIAVPGDIENISKELQDLLKTELMRTLSRFTERMGIAEARSNIVYAAKERIDHFSSFVTKAEELRASCEPSANIVIVSQSKARDHLFKGEEFSFFNSHYKPGLAIFTDPITLPPGRYSTYQHPRGAFFAGEVVLSLVSASHKLATS